MINKYKVVKYLIICDDTQYKGNNQGGKKETNGRGQRTKEREIQMGYAGNAYLKSDVSHETPRIRKSCPREDAEGKGFSQKEQGMKALWWGRSCILPSVN